MNKLIIFAVHLASTISLSHISTASAQSSFCNAPGGKRIVPNLIGLSKSEAADALENCDLLLKVDGIRAVSKMKSGTIAVQAPLGGDVTDKDSEVAIQYSAGLYLPNLVGHMAEDARDWLKDIGLEATIRLVRSPDAAVGRIMVQTPKTGDYFNFGDPIELVVSDGQWVIVESQIGQEYYDASKALSSAGLNPTHTSGNLDSGTNPVGVCYFERYFPVVATQSPINGEIRYGSKVQITTRRWSKVYRVDNQCIEP